MAKLLLPCVPCAAVLRGEEPHMRWSRFLAGASVPFVLAATLLAGGAGASPRAVQAVPVNINISRAQHNQSEDTIAINPVNPLQMTVVSNEGETIGMFHGWSTDGGRT